MCFNKNIDHVASVWFSYILFVESNWKISSQDVYCKYLQNNNSSILCYEFPEYLTSEKAYDSKRLEKEESIERIKCIWWMKPVRKKPFKSIYPSMLFLKFCALPNPNILAFQDRPSKLFN